MWVFESGGVGYFGCYGWGDKVEVVFGWWEDEVVYRGDRGVGIWDWVVVDGDEGGWCFFFYEI